ncbi:efflux RND transporter periplasmic adaptor subunit [Rhizobium sp. Root1220]|uniref:efflux RND transporter periplasmic adaptor subunit n=1 Tax=Rhizobium sp. Root1220 TaxID=1736432 RepID=UPI0006FC1954|nr:efflux RND transporter periplasmic adaptor subunit [Rhizobium sp. Root1220]KQV83563.1 RND transporter [Rhizobium sp. Root1220]
MLEPARRIAWRRVIWPICVASICGIMALAWFADARRGEEAQATEAAPATPVEVARPVIGDIPVYLVGLGSVQAFNTITAMTRVDGELQSVHFTEGQFVKRGDLLAVVDPAPYQAALDQAEAKIQQDEADLANAKFLLGKDQKLTTQGITTQDALETQQSLVNQLTAQLAQDKAAKMGAEVALGYTQILSPIDGRTGIRLVDAGNQVHTTDTTGIVVITQTQPISVMSTLQEGDLGSVRAAIAHGTVEVVALSSDQSTTIATGTLSLIDNEIEQSSGTIRLKSKFQNADNALWPGQFVTLKLRSQTIPNALTVPSAALQRGTVGFFVYVVKPDNTVSVRTVTPGPIADGKTVITDGLAASDIVVTEGQYRLQEGTKVSFTQAPSSLNAVPEAK